MVVLTVCVGNVCRSPVAAAALAREAPWLEVRSAGLAPMTGSDVDPLTLSAAEAAGLGVPRHRAQALDEDVVEGVDLVLVMEPFQIDAIAVARPDLRDRTLLFGLWLGNEAIADPRGRSLGVHARCVERILAAAASWRSRLDAPAKRKGAR